MEIELRRLEEAVISHLGPYLGESMARAALSGHCRNLGIRGETIAGDQIETLLLRLRQGMKLFVGAEKAESLAGELKREVDLGAVS